MSLSKIVGDIEKALQVELKMGCIDTAVMGGFSTFIMKSVKLALDSTKNEELSAAMQKLRNIFPNYIEMDKKSRRDAVLQGLQVLKETIKLNKPAATEDNNSIALGEVSLQYIKNIGPKRSKLLNKMGIFSAGDLLYHIPRRYEDRSNLKPFYALQHGEVETARGVLLGLQDIRPRRGLTITKAALRDGTSMGYAVWFNQPFIKKQLQPGCELIVTGKVDKKFGNVQIAVTDFEILDGEDTTHVGRIVPVYPVTEGLPQRALRTIIKNLLDTCNEQIQDLLPEYLRTTLKLPDLHDALNNIHFPSDWDVLDKARTRLVFEEFLILQLGLNAIKNNRQTEVVGIAHKQGGDLLKSFYEILPFSLTEAQNRVLKDIFRDMERAKPMNRLLQGDVGSGKTIVSAAALVKTVENGHQGVLMAPTEILAEQHFLGLSELFSALGLQVSLLTGSVSKKDKEAVLKDIREGRTDIIVGTHAVIQDEVEFDRLGLVITDEQHRFGVKQRAKLQKKGTSPDVLVMTATPIPRTLAMTVYGDLDVSVIDQLPPGRQPVKTYWITEHKRMKMYEFIRQQVTNGRQVYFVCPLVEESEKLDVQAAVETAERLKGVFPDLKIGLLHGRVKPREKDEVMMAFRYGKLDILVATTVIEVGVNVPNATIMVIEDAERFGLAQLHQLRGRVGRGSFQSYCFMLADPKTEEGRARMEIMQASADGFKIAEEDLKLRGPGDIFGTRQSGLPDLKIADIVRDVKVLERAQKIANEILQKDPNLSAQEHSGIKKQVIEKFKGKYHFVNIS